MSSAYDNLRAGPFVPQGPLGSLRLRAGVAAYEQLRLLQPNDNALHGLGTIALAGPAGPAGSSFDSYPCVQPVSGHWVIALVAGVAVPADQSSLIHMDAVVGLSTSGVAAGAQVTVQRGGLLVEPSWSWVPGLPLFAVGLGGLSQSPPTSGSLRVLGVAQSPTSILVALREPYTLQG